LHQYRHRTRHTSPFDTPLNLTRFTANSVGSTIDGSSFSGLLTRIEIGHIRIGSDGNGPHQFASVGFVAQPANIHYGNRNVSFAKAGILIKGSP
jgi:hypothetical protein